MSGITTKKNELNVDHLYFLSCIHGHITLI